MNKIRACEKAYYFKVRTPKTIKMTDIILGRMFLRWWQAIATTTANSLSNQNIKNHNENVITCEMTYKFDTKALCKMIGMLDV